MIASPCQSIPPKLGTFRPELRVNYAYGMVMGVDDFRQEQFYHVERERLDTRALHGFGVSYGLKVETEPRGADLLIRVKDGLAVDPRGRDILVGEDQCLLLNEWLASHADEVAKHRGGDKLKVCITLEYVECLDNLVPVPGVPCASDDENQAYSRIRESFALRLSFDRPREVGEYATRRFGEILDHIELDPAGDKTSDEKRIIELVRAIGDEVEGGTFASPPLSSGVGTPLQVWELLHLPLDDARAAMRRIFDVWISEVRPRVIAIETGADPASHVEPDDRICLGCLTVLLDGNQYRAGSAALDTDCRPVLLNTRTIQELFLTGAWRALDDAMEFATLIAVEPRKIRVWIHYPQQLKIPDVLPTITATVAGLTLPALHTAVAGLTPVAGVVASSLTAPLAASAIGIRPFLPLLRRLNSAIAVKVNDIVDIGARIKPVAGAPNLFEITTSADLPDGARISVGFDAHRVTVDGSGEELAHAIERDDVVYVSRWRDWLYTSGSVSGLVRSRRFVNVRAINSRTLELWFHANDKIGFKSDFTLLRDGSAAPLSFDVETSPLGGTRSTLWFLTLKTAEADFKNGDRLEFRFNASQIYHGPGTKLLKTVITETDTDFLGWDGTDTIFVFEEISIIVIPADKPNVVFARLCLVRENALRIWIDAPRPLQLHAAEGTRPSLSILVNGAAVKPISATPVDWDDNVWDVTFHPPVDVPDVRIEVTFDADQIDLIAPFGGLTPPVTTTPAHTPLATPPGLAPGAMLRGTANLVSAELSVLLARGGRGGKLSSVLDDFPWTYVNRTKNLIRVFHLHCCCSPRICHFVTVHRKSPIELGLWFHTDEPLKFGKEIEVMRGVDAPKTSHLILPDPANPTGFQKLWVVRTGDEKPFTPGQHLTLLFDVNRIWYSPTKQRLLREYMVEQEGKFVCFDGKQYIRAYFVVPPLTPTEDIPRTPAADLPEFDDRIRTIVSGMGEGILREVLTRHPGTPATGTPAAPVTTTPPAPPLTTTTVPAQPTLDDLLIARIRPALTPAISEAAGAVFTGRAPALATESAAAAVDARGPDIVRRVLRDEGSTLLTPLIRTAVGSALAAPVQLVALQRIAANSYMASITVDPSGRTPWEVTKLALRATRLFGEGSPADVAVKASPTRPATPAGLPSVRVPNVWYLDVDVPAAAAAQGGFLQFQFDLDATVVRKGADPAAALMPLAKATAELGIRYNNAHADQAGHTDVLVQVFHQAG